MHEVVGKGKAVVTEEQVAHSLIDLSKKKRTTDQFILVRRDQTSHDSTTGPSSQPEDDTTEKVIHESSSTSDSERTESETETAAPKDPEKAHEALAGPDPEPMKEDQTGSDSGKLHVSLAGPNPEHMDDEFLATAYPKVHENLKLITDERVIDDKPENLIEKSLCCRPRVYQNQESERRVRILDYQNQKRNKVRRNRFQLTPSGQSDKMKTPWIGEVADKVKQREKIDSAASGSAQPPPKDDDQSSKKPRESDASATKQHPALTSTGWQITYTRDAGVDSSMHRSDLRIRHF
ncbi:hypothetical protein Tco_0734848 [Tanacetum coccineum]